jgi:hypothetical protein
MRTFRSTAKTRYDIFLYDMFLQEDHGTFVLAQLVLPTANRQTAPQ